MNKPRIRVNPHRREHWAYSGLKWVCVGTNEDGVRCIGSGDTPTDAYSVWKRLAAHRYSRRTTDVAA